MDSSSAIDSEQDEAAFSAGFNSVRPSDDYTSPEESEIEAHQDAAGDADPQDDTEPEAFAGAGMTAAQIKEILLRTAKFEEQLGKAHGKIGELNRTLQEIRQAKQNDPIERNDAGGGITTDDTTWEEVEDVFPGFSQKFSDQAKRLALEAVQTAGQPTIDHHELMRTMAVAVMDATQPGWRETVSSDDFSLWIAAQPEDIRETFNSTVDVGQFTSILREFNDSRRPAQDRNKRRLESSITPDARASKAHHAMTDEQAFKYGFDSVRKTRHF